MVHTSTSHARTLLIVLDGFGIGKDSPFNAIANAKMPFYKELLKKYPHSQLLTHGAAVGLPDGIMGNSEVGHMTMGAGRIIYQDLVRINRSIRDRSFFSNPVLKHALRAGVQGRVHLMGLLSDGGVHSHIDHAFALLDFCIEQEIPRIAFHAFLDGRDTPPDSSRRYLEKLLRHPAFHGTDQNPPRATLASVMGRYWAMDRDKRWDRIDRAYQVLTGQAPPFAAQDPAEPAVFQAIEASYRAGKSDEFVEPVLIDPDGAMRTGDSIIFFNYRADRAREISEKILGYSSFKPSAYVGMTLYDRKLAVPAAFEPQNLNNIFAQWIYERGMSQFRIAETEKYAHVTFFFNGGREEPFPQEERVLIPSPRDVATYDLKPEMSAFAVAEEARARLARESDAYPFVMMNFANADMVGHTGQYEAAIRAMEALDQCLEKVVGAAEKNGYSTIITADHGNAEEMCDADGRPHTQHTLNPVPAILVSPGSAIAPKSHRVPMADGGLADIMPTLCELMNLPVPPEVTGKSLVRT